MSGRSGRPVGAFGAALSATLKATTEQPVTAAQRDGGPANRLTLKWGTVKGWELHSDEAVAALQKWADFGVSASAMAQKDTPEQQEALLAAIDHMDEIYLDWEDRYVSRDEAKEYVRNYRMEQP